jgi:ATP-dependent Clp protease ATP-binding subunit ClpC
MQSSKRLKSKSNAANAFPLRPKCKPVLNFAAEEAERLGQRHVGTEHLLLGLLRGENALAAVTLRRHGAHLTEIRLKLAEQC